MDQHSAVCRGLSDETGLLHAAGPARAGLIVIVVSDTIVTRHCRACLPLPVHLTLQFHKTEATGVSLVELNNENAVVINFLV